MFVGCTKQSFVITQSMQALSEGQCLVFVLHACAQCVVLTGWHRGIGGLTGQGFEMGVGRATIAGRFQWCACRSQV